MSTSNAGPKDGAPGEGQGPSRVAALDGVRGLAIALVMVHHFTYLGKEHVLDKAFHGLCKLGWSGVDLFFVLSGYLITGILVENRGDPRYFSTFYARRALRILPLYYVSLFLILHVLPRVVDVGTLNASEVWYWVHLSNLSMAQDGLSHKTLSITWSLAIEEQFYLVWPLLVSLVPPRHLARVCLGVALASFAARSVAALLGTGWTALYVLTPFRLDPLAIGAFLAVVPKETLMGWGKRAVWIFVGGWAVVAAAAVVARSPKLEGPIGQSIGTLALTIAWAGLVVWVLATERGARVMSNRFLTIFGKYSYGLYLIHLPVNYALRDNVYGPKQFFRIGGTAVPGQIVYFLFVGAASLGVAMLSWRLFEEPILRLKRHFRYGRREDPQPR